MNPQQTSAVYLAKKLLLVVLAAISIFLFFTLTSAQSQSSEKPRINGKLLADKEPPEERTSFTENGPTGHWSASILPDLTRNSSNSPVVIVGTSMLMGNAEWRNLQLTHVTVTNYSAKTVLGLQIKWFVTTKEDTTKILSPPGYTGLFAARVLPGQTIQGESPLVKFSQAIKYLTTNNSLEGHFLVHIKAFQVEFEDGTSWNDDSGGPKPGNSGEPWRAVPEENPKPTVESPFNPPRQRRKEGSQT